MEANNYILQKGYRLASDSRTYTIERKLGQGGFGITYLASFTQQGRVQVAGNLSSFDEEAEQQVSVVIKEFYIREISSRNGDTAMVTFGSSSGQGRFVEAFKQKMGKEAGFLSRLNHPNIARVSEIFEANNTVYIVMQYIRGESLSEKISRLKKIPVNDAVRYTAQICDALEEVHRNNILHLDVKPGNILLDRQDNARLIDFGVSKQYNDSHEETSHSVMGKSDGYAPIEQYEESGLASFSPSIDIYALGATLYCMLTGVKPIPAPARMHTDFAPPSVLDPSIPQALSDAVMKAMDLFARNRYQSAAAFKAAIEGTKTGRTEEVTVIDDNIISEITKADLPEADTQAEPPPKPQPDKPKPKADRTPAIIAGVITGLLALFLLIVVFSSKDDSVQPARRAKPVSIDIPLVYVSGGTFTMGCTAEQGEDCHNSEKPAHQVTVDGFHIGRYEVTQAQWQAVTGSNPSKFRGDNLPVEQVSWDDIVGTSGVYMTIRNIKYYEDGFIYKLNKLTGKQYRLPTEAEWEYAARGGAGSRGYKYSGSNVPGNVVWYLDDSGRKTHPVGTKSPNELGIYNMSGNVGEWCSDRYGNYSSNSQTNPTGSATSSATGTRIYRGGSWNHSVMNGRVSSRSEEYSNYRNSILGFRLACSSDEPVSARPQENRPAAQNEPVSTSPQETRPTTQDEPVSTSPQETRPAAQDESVSVRPQENKPEPQAKPVSIDIPLVHVSGGTFTMGCTAEQGSDCYSNEKPAHQVTVDGFYIGKYEVTQAQWKAVTGSNPSEFKGDNLPVENVSWNDIVGTSGDYMTIRSIKYYADGFIYKLNKQTGKQYRLPTEAEWEYAARGVSGSRSWKYSGSNVLGNVAWYKDNSGEKSHPVGTKSPNDLGIYDMAGNVWEWCSDRYDEYTSNSQTNPTGPATGSSRVLRGGSWHNFGGSCRVLYRNSGTPDDRRSSLGFRLACSSDDPVSTRPQENRPKPQDEPVSTNIPLVYVSGGTFMMGCTAEQGRDCENNEEPAHRVTVDGYYIGKYEVTQSQWKAVTGSNPSKNKGDNLPVECVSWNDIVGTSGDYMTIRSIKYYADGFIYKLNKLTGKQYRLPTEAEWEYAARGGSGSRGYKYSGSNAADNVAWYGNKVYNTHPVGTKSANEPGIYDMSGNVMEWCSDWYGGYSSNSQTNPTGPTTGSFRVNRGGSWNSGAGSCRVSARLNSVSGARNFDLGFRLASDSK